MIGIRRALKIILMAREAILGCACEAAINVAARAIHGAVRTEQWKRGAAVIEPRPAKAGHLPTGDHIAMTLFATERESCLLVIRIRRGVIIFCMTRATLQRQIDELRRSTLCVAIVASYMLMPAQQRKARLLMHERDFGNVLPALQGVATRAVLAERAVMHIFMASATLFRHAGKFQGDVTLFAVHARMLPFQCEPGLLMPEFQILPQRRPTFGRMAIAARNFNVAVRMIDRCHLR